VAGLKGHQVSFRLDSEREKKLEEILNHYGLSSAGNATENYRSLIDQLHLALVNAKNAQTLIKADAENNAVDISCPLRFKAEKILKDVDPKTRKTFFKKGFVPYCFQWEKGKLKRPLELINAVEQCRRCKPLMDAWIAQQAAIKLERSDAEGDAVTVAPPPVMPRAVLQKSPQEPEVYTPVRGYEKTLNFVRKDGGKFCPYDNTIVYKWNCINCERHHPAKYQACCLLHLNFKPALPAQTP
jgi:hypothetical protein